MAIKINLHPTTEDLTGKSHWWGFPDLPDAFDWPCGSDSETLLTFICQINCNDIAPFDPENKLPHEGMLYFFAAMDEWLGYESPTHNGLGEWEKGHFVVKYAKAINFETFRSCILVDDEDQSLTEPELEIEFAECEPGAQGHKLLGIPFFEDVRNEYPEMMNLLQIDDDEDLGIRLYDCGNINLMIKESDLKFGNWKKVKAYMHSL